jgi:hypothetical protein
VADIFETPNAEIRKLLLRWTRTPIAWDGLNMGAFTPPTGAPWIRPSITDVSADQRSFGKAGLTHQVGILFIQVFVPLGSGETQLLQYLRELAGIFRGAKVGGLVFREPERRIIGPDEAWYQGNLEVVFDYLVHMPAGQVEGFESMVFTLADNDFAVLDALYLNGTVWTKADASSTTSRAIALVSATIGDQFTAISHGFVTISTGHGLGSSGTLWLSTAAGIIGTTAPDDVVQEMGVIVDANTILLDIKAHST